MLSIVQADLRQKKHSDAYLSLMSHYAKDPMGGGEDLSEFAKTNLIPTLLNRKDIYIILIFDGETPVALLTAIEGFSTFSCKPLLNIHDVMVHSKYRGQGLSKKLFIKIEEVAKQLHCCKMTLEVLEGNGIAKKAYNNLGFHPYQLDPKQGSALFLTKALS